MQIEKTKAIEAGSVKVEIPEAFAELFEPARYKAFYGGRGSAKSHSFAAALLLLGGKAKLRILCAREVQKSIKDSVKALLDDKIDALGLADFYESVQSEIRGKNGTRFIFAGLSTMSADQIKSLEGVDIVWVEEAHTISDGSLEILIPTIRKPGSELWFSWNPRSASDPIDKRFRGEVVPERSVIRRVSHLDNTFFTKELEAERVFDKANRPDRYAHVWEGEYEPTAVGAIWDRQTINQTRRATAPVLNRVLVAVDPAVSSTDGSNLHGIVVVAEGEDGRGYVLADVSAKGTPREWANRAVATMDRFEADGIVVEINQGGDMVKSTLEAARPGVRVVEVRATRGKHVRAEPISALYSLGQISHIGTFEELENQMCQMTMAGYEGPGSPDRVDALVWGLTELFPSLVQVKAEPEFVGRVSRSGSWMGA